MTAKTVTVFGGSGFLGRYVVRRLAATGARVTVAVRNAESAKFLKPLGNVGQITLLPTRLQDPISVERALKGAEAAINLVGILHEGGSQRFDAVQGDGAARIAETAARFGISRMVHVSAIGADANSQSSYARSKAAGEAAVLAALPKASVLRPSVIFGPEDGFFNRFALLARMLPFLPLYGGGHTRFQPVYVGDVADGVMAALNSPAAQGKIFELGGPRSYSFRELMDIVLQETRRKVPLVSLPWWVGDLQGAVLEHLPVPPLTRDQMKLLREDNVVHQGMPGLGDLGIKPTSVEAVVPTYLARHRKGGQFSQTLEA